MQYIHAFYLIILYLGETTPRRALRSNRSLLEDPLEDSSQTPQQVLSW